MIHPSPTLILASASPRRRELLGLLELPFTVIPSAYDEQLPASSPDADGLARHLAMEKAREVAAHNPEAVVVGTDTVVALRDRIYGKPQDAGDAHRMLSELSGNTHRVITGVALLREGRSEQVFSVTTDVRFRHLDAREIEAYVRTGDPMDKAGAYAIQGQAALFIEGIQGDYFNVVGLPVTALALALREHGFSILGLPQPLPT